MRRAAIAAIGAFLGLHAPSIASAQSPRPLADYSDIVAKVKPAVVSLTVYKKPATFGSSFPPGFLERFGERKDEDGEYVRGGEVKLRSEQGTAFVFDAVKGQLITTAYMIEGAERVEVQLANGEKREAKIVGRDDVSGVGMVQISPGGLSNIVWSTKPPRAGEPALVLGNAQNLGVSVIAGMVANPDIDFSGNTEKMFLLDLAMMRGTAGGPVVDATGAVIGMAAAQYGSSSNAYENLGIAYDGVEVRRIATILARDGKIQRGKIGVTIEEDWRRSVAITEVVKGSSAEKAGLKPGDVVLKIAGEKVTSRGMLTNVVGIQPIGSTVLLTIKRGNEVRDVSVVVAAALPE